MEPASAIVRASLDYTIIENKGVMEHTLQNIMHYAALLLYYY